jgi:hypothetical protein
MACQLALAAGKIYESVTSATLTAQAGTAPIGRAQKLASHAQKKIKHWLPT